MPCWEVNKVSVEFKGGNVNLIEAAAGSLMLAFSRRGDRVTVGDIEIDLVKGTATGRNQAGINRLKRAYSKAAVRKASRANGWSVSEKEGNRLVVRKW